MCGSASVQASLKEVAERNKLFGAIKTSAQWQQVFRGTAGAIHPEVAPANDEPVVVKHRVNAFHRTDLEMICERSRSTR